MAAFAVAAVTLGALAVILRGASAWGPDLAITLWLQSWQGPDLTGFFALVSWFGYFPQGVIVTAAVAFVFRRDWLWVAGTYVATLLNVALKLLVARPRPTDDLVRVYFELQDLSFPSGHVAFSTTLFGFALFLAYLRPATRWRSVAIVLLAMPIVLVGVSRIYLGHHWPSDVLGGYALGTAVLVPYGALYASRRR